MIPDADTRSGYLPPGTHYAEWSEVVSRFASNRHRSRLTEGLLAACRSLAAAGCRTLLLNGSFVTAKPLPGDYDGAWETAGVDPSKLDPTLLDFTRGRAAMKAKYGGELFPASNSAAPGVAFRDFFRTDRDGIEKGVVLIDLGSLP